MTTSVTSEKVRELYNQYSNKCLFLAQFGTSRFNIVSTETLDEMHNFLVKKLK